MYAGRIKIVATEKGAGVNSAGPMAANAGDMNITADGKLVLSRARAERQLTASSGSAAIEVKDTLYAKQAIALTGKSAVRLAGKALVASAGDTSLKAEAVTLGQAALAASGLGEDGKQNPTGDLNIEADRLTAGDGQLAAGRTLTVSAAVIDLDRAAAGGPEALRSLDDMKLNTRMVFARNARISALGALQLKSAAALTLTGGEYASGGRLLAEGQALSNSAALNAKDTLTLRSTGGQLVNRGRVAGDKGARLSVATTLLNEGDLLSMKSIRVDARGAATNTATGRIAANDSITLNVASLANAGRVIVQGKGENAALTLNTAGGLDNRGALSGARAALNIDGALTNRGQLRFSGALTLKGHRNDQSAGLINHTGGLISGGSGDYTARTLSNAGVLEAGAGRWR